MSRKLRIHFVVPGSVAPAPHHEAGIIPLKNGPADQLGTGLISVVACDPKIKFSEYDNGTNVPYAVQCADCVKTEVWKAAYKATPHPRLLGATPATDEGDAEASAAAMRECC